MYSKGVIFLRWFLSSLFEQLEMESSLRKKRQFESRRSGNGGDSSVYPIAAMKSVRTPIPFSIEEEPISVVIDRDDPRNDVHRTIVTYKEHQTMGWVMLVE